MKNEIMGKRTTWADVHGLYGHSLTARIYFEHNGLLSWAAYTSEDSSVTHWCFKKPDGDTGYGANLGEGLKILPLLRRLESITLDEQKDLAIAVGWELDQWDAVFTEGDLTTNICEEHPLTYLDRFVGYPKAILWLLDNHFCLWPELFEYGEVGELQV